MSHAVKRYAFQFDSHNLLVPHPVYYVIVLAQQRHSDTPSTISWPCGKNQTDLNDTDAFNQVLAALRLPRVTGEELATRNKALESANQAATRVPLEVLERSVEALDLALVVAREGNPTAVTDAGVAGACAMAASEGAALNVRINLSSLTDAAWIHSTESAATELIERCRALATEVRETVESALSVN